MLEMAGKVGDTHKKERMPKECVITVCFQQTVNAVNASAQHIELKKQRSATSTF